MLTKYTLRLQPEAKEKLDQLTSNYCQERKLKNSSQKNQYLNHLISEAYKEMIKKS